MRPAPQHLRTFMVTFATSERRRIFQTEQNALLMQATLQTYRAQGRYHLHAYVIMPDHLHLLLTPAPDIPLEKTVQLIKGGFSFRLKARGDVWTRGRFDHRIPDRAAFDAAVHYIHENPVRARLVQQADFYPFSSASRAQDTDPRPVWFRAPPPWIPDPRHTVQHPGLKPVTATPELAG